MTTLTVGSGKQYSTIAAAVGAAGDGDTVQVDAGTYTNDFFTIGHKITLQSVGGMVYDVATVAPTNGKAIATVDADAVIDGFGFTGARVSDANGAGIRYEAGNLVIRNSLFWNNQDGILGAPNATGTIRIENSEFSNNGGENGLTHNIYIGDIASFTLVNSYIHDAAGGHEVKSRAEVNDIENNRIFDNSADGSYSIDLPNGGVGLVKNNIIEKGVNAPNYSTIHFGGEATPYAGSSLMVTGNTIVNDNANGILILNQSGLSTVTVTGNQLWNFNAPNSGAVSQTGNTALTARPTLDTTTTAPVITPLEPVPVDTSVPDGVSLKTWGVAGAVTASGRVLMVGAGQAFTSLGAALSASRDGDTIDVLAGDYVNDFAVSNHKVIIQGVGGIAHFIGTSSVKEFPALLQIHNDATLSNLSFSGATNYNGHAGGLWITDGNVTINNSNFDHNDQAMLVENNSAINLSIFNSEFNANGNGDKGTNNLNIGAVGSVTIKNSSIHGASTGHELADYAYFSDIENNRIVDGPDAYASFGIDLGLGGKAIIKNNVIEKGQQAQNGILILAGGEGALYDNTDIQITGNTFVSDLANRDHPYTYFVVANAPRSGAAVAHTTLTGNVFVGGVPGSSQAERITTVAGNTTARSAVVDMTTPGYSAALAPAVPAAVPGKDLLSVTLTATATLVPAQFTVAVDGTVVGGGAVAARDGTDPAQMFTFTGNWSSGSHTVAVTETLAGQDGSAHLYVNTVALDGSRSTTRTDLSVYSPTATFTLAANNPDFDAKYYSARNPDVVKAGMDPLQHYLTFGWKEGRDPSAFFSTAFYLERNPDVARSGMDPLLHFEQFGWKEGRDASGLFATTRYTAANPDWAASGANDPLAAFMASGKAPSIPAASAYAQPEYKYFDKSYYLAHNPDVAAAHVDPLAHYEVYGWNEGRNPSASFGTSLYLKNNPDVAAAHVDPLAQYAINGLLEGRAIYAVAG